MEPERVAASVMLWDGRMLAAMVHGDPEQLLEGREVSAKLQIVKPRHVSDFESFKKLVKSLGARWNPEAKAWEVWPALRDYGLVSDAVERLNEIGASFFLIYEGKTEVRLTPEDVDSAFLEGLSIINELSRDYSLLIKFKTFKDKDLFKDLVALAPYYKGHFYLPPFGRLPREVADGVRSKARDSAALVASRRFDEGYPLFLGNSAVLELSEEDAVRLQETLAPYEECDIDSPEIERERRENALSLCEYRWVNQAGDLVREGRLVRLYDVRFEDGKAYVRVYRGLLVRLLRHLGIGVSKLYAKLPLEPAAPFLRDYQREAVSQALKMMSLQGAATIQAATGAGKTEMAVALAKTLLESRSVRKVFFLSLNRTLNVQAVMRFKKYGIDAGLVDSENFDVEKPVVACTVQTLYRALVKIGKAKDIRDEVEEEIRMDYVDLSEERAKKLFEEYMKAGLVIVDEVQHVPARTVSEAVRANPWSLRLGLSATPWRDDGRDVLIYALIGDVVPRKITSSELIDKGFLVPVKIYMVRRKLEVGEEDLEALKGLQGAQRYVKLKNFVFYNDRRNEDVAELVKALPKPSLVLVKEIRHAHELCRKIKEKGLSCAVLTGKESSQQRESVLKLVMKERIDVVVATTLADEGLDLPPLRSLVLAAGGRSQTRTLQRVGRITRPYDGKKVGLVIDIWDDDREAGGIFYRQGLARRELYATEPLWSVEEGTLKSIIKKMKSLDTSNSF
ncbi:MAG: DEAD/DEAH box helicase [Crenarchaeota archaeon]|nr:DEAD/DEAH box helicase [Thermoproteota archaeon]